MSWLPEVNLFVSKPPGQSFAWVFSFSLPPFPGLRPFLLLGKRREKTKDLRPKIAKEFPGIRLGPKINSPTASLSQLMRGLWAAKPKAEA